MGTEPDLIDDDIERGNFGHQSMVEVKNVIDRKKSFRYSRLITRHEDAPARVVRRAQCLSHPRKKFHVLGTVHMSVIPDERAISIQDERRYPGLPTRPGLDNCGDTLALAEVAVHRNYSRHTNRPV